jgi:hypothetical protein
MLIFYAELLLQCLGGPSFVGQNHDIKVTNKFFKNMAKCKYFGTTEANQNCIHEQIKCILHTRIAHYHAVQNHLSSHLLYESIMMKIHKAVISPFILYRCESGSSLLRVEQRLRIF